MNLQPKPFMRVLLSIVLLFGLTVTNLAQSKDGAKSVTDYTSYAQITGTAEGKTISYTNPYTHNSASNFAGTFNGTLNSNPEKFYCIDLQHGLVYNQDYWDEGSTSSEITYVLNHYYPYKTSYSGKLSDNNEEAASVQFAIWHFSDGVDPNTITNNNNVKNRALAIIADANANHNVVEYLQTLLIIPPAQSFVQGTPANFDIYATDINGNPLSGIQVHLTTTLGTLSATTVTTDASGHAGPITLTYSGTGTATIKAKADIEIPQGTRYVHKNYPDTKQKLVLATPSFDEKEITATVEWYTPGDCDLNGYMTFTPGGWGSSSNSTPGKIRDLYFNSVFPSGLTVGGNYTLELTSASAVKDFLPSGGTPAALTQNYIDPGNSLSNTLAGHVVTLTLNVEFDRAGYLGTNSTDLANLIIASGTFYGLTVDQFLAIANTALGGGATSYSYSDITDAATAINENFDNGTVDNGYLICEAPKASLGDKVWFDTDKDGKQDSGENGISNITVKLYDCLDNLIATTTTDANGNYLFSNLNPGDYYVMFMLPSGYVFTTKDAGSDDAKDSDADTSTGKTICTTLTAGENDLTWDAGVYEECKNKIGDFVWHDKDVDGIQDSGEPGIPGVVVELLQNSNVIATDTTDANGKYEFANLNNGSYSVKVASSNYNAGGVLESTSQTKWYSTKKNQGSDDAKDSDADKNQSVSVTLNCNDNLTIDFGFYKTCVSVTKTADKQTAQPGDVITYTFTVENCGDITLSGGVDFYDALLNPTAPHHIKNISPVNPGETKSFTKTYTVKTTDCGELINTVTAIGHPIDGSANVEFTSSVTVFIDCEEPCTGEIGDYVFVDMTGDCNGGQVGSVPIEGAVVKLTYTENNQTIVKTDTTNAQGKYFFINLCDNNYVVEIVSVPAQYQSYTLSTPGSFNVTLSNNQKYYDADFGYCPPADLCGGFYVHFDSVTNNGNGTSTWTYTITGINAAHDLSHWVLALCENNVVSASPEPWEVVTDPTTGLFGIKWDVPVNKDGGQVTFSVTLNGQFEAVVTDLAIKAGQDIIYCTTMGPKCEEECMNKIGDFIWHDMDTDGIQDTDEPGLANVVVELLDAQGNLLQTTTTDTNGYYFFDNLPNGTYKVRVAASNFTGSGVLAGSQSEKWFLTFKDKGSDDAKDSDGDNNKTATVTVNCNDDLTIDFGFFKVCVSMIKTGPATVNVGETITYTFTVSNCGDVLLSGGANVYDPMLKPSGDHKIKYLQLYPGQSATFTYDYETTPNDCGELINEAWVIGHPSLDNYNFGGSTVRYDDSHTVIVNCEEKEADLEINKTSSESNPECGEQFYYTITVKNNGPDKSEGIVASDLLPSGADYISHTTSQGTYDQNTGIWNVGDLNSGSTATLTIYVKVDCDQVNNSTFDLGVAADYNLFVIEDVDQPSSDTQGKVAVGGNANFANYSIGDQLPMNSGDVLIVDGDLTYLSGRVYGNVVYGNTTNLPIPGVTVDGTISQGNPIDFAAAKIYLENLSLSLSGYTVNGTTTFQWGGLTLSGTDPFLNVFAVSGSDLSSANNVTINVPNGSAVLVNIDGTNINWTGGLTVNGTAINNVLYNFYQATSMTIQGIDIRGSILAPFADINFAAGVINGQMICKSLIGMGQMNLSLFGGNIPGEKEITNVAIIVSSITIDPNPNNNSASVEVIVGGSDNGGNNGGGDDWQYVNGFGEGEIVYSMIFDGQNIYAGTWGGKIYMSSNDGQTWTVINAGMNVSFIWSLQISGGYIFAATELGVYIYNGSTWSLTSLAGIDVHSLTVSGGVIYAGTWGLGVYKSTDNGTTWLPMNNGLSYFLTIQSVTATASGELFAASVGGGVFKFDGSAWVNVNIGYDFVWVMNSSSSAIFAGTYGDGLYRSFDGGATWSKVTTLNAPFIYSISVSASGKVYIASWASGVFESTDNGNTWTSLGLGGFGVSSLMVPTGSDDLFVGTKEGKIYMSKSTGTATDVNDGLSEVPTKFELNQNYPNPFNPSTTIQFAVPEAGNYTVKVFNVLGQEVATLLNGEIGSGMHKVTFDAGNLASGIYVYRLVGNNVNMSKKMILTK